jgi:hypothetical protein
VHADDPEHGGRWPISPGGHRHRTGIESAIPMFRDKSAIQNLMNRGVDAIIVNPGDRTA